MPKKRGIIIIIISAVLFSCEIFLIPPAARLNPNDQFNPVPPPHNLNIYFNLEDLENRFARLSWSEYDYELYIESENYTSQYSGSIILRKTGAAPENIFDGLVITGVIPATGESMVYDDYEFIPGTRNYYSVFSYGAKWDENEMEQGEKLNVNENGVLENYENYNFTGPVSGSVTPWRYIDIPVTDDAHISANGRDFGGDNPLLVSSASSAPQYLSCLTFSLNIPEDENIKYAQLNLVIAQSSDIAGGLVELAPLHFPWDGQGLSTLDDPAVDDTAVYYGYEQTQAVNGTDGDPFWYNITDLYKALVDGSVDNNGLRLITFDGTNTHYFYSIESQNPPFIRLMTFDE